MSGSPPDAAATGLFAQFAAVLGANLAYLRARLALAGIEGREALGNYALILALAVAALVIAIFGYLFFMFALVSLIAWWFEGGAAWIWVTLGAGILHFIAAAALLLVAKTRFSRRMFAATLDEFKKDQEWLTARAKPN